MRILLTGSSGFLGKELYKKLTLAGHTVLGLSRHGPDIYGDITDLNCGIESEIGPIDCLIHSAALLSFAKSQRKEIFRVNVDGTANLCKIALYYNIGRVIYISTAYVCGNYRGKWDENDLNRGQKFKNPYEESKYEGEQLIHTLPSNFSKTVFRPSIIVGNSHNGESTSFDGFYRPVRAIARIMKLVEKDLKLPPRERSEEILHLPRLHVPLTIMGDPDSTLNLVPIDWVADKIVENLDKVGTFHLTNPSPPTNREVVETINQVLGITGPHFEKEGDYRNRGPQDTIYQRMIRDFSPYLQYEPKFNSSVNSELLLTKANIEFIIKIIRYWRGTGVK